MAIDPKKQLPNPKKVANDEFFDAMVRHQIFLMRLSGSIRNEIIDLLNATEADLRAAILASEISGDSPEDFVALIKLRKQITETRAPVWAEISQVLDKHMRSLALAEPVFVAGVTQTVVPVILEMGFPSPKLLNNIVTAIPFEGKVLKQWSKKLGRDDFDRIESQIKIGMVQGESTAEISRRVVGTVSLKGKDGVTQISRNQAAAITRTAVNHIANQSRREMFLANSDIFSKEQYVATLDSRTTPICRSLDGELFDVGVGPIPPLHFSCRSLRIAVIDGNVIAQRPAKSSTTRAMLDDFAKDQGIRKVRKRGDLPFGTKGKYDVFARSEVRRLTGTVPGKLTYQQWLTRQSKSFQEDVLGKTKAKLFRDGDLTLDKFVNRKGDELNLSELASKHKMAFKDAGLDPEDFL